MPKPKRKVDRTAKISHTVRGKNLNIGPYAVIGIEGFGFDPKNPSQRWPHVGRVILKDGVEVGANSVIERGVLTDTIIGVNTKLDHLTLVGHGVVIGDNCKFAAGAKVGGSTSIGNNCFIGLNATIKDHVRVANNVFVGQQANVINDVPEGWVVVGNPARRLEKSSHTCVKCASKNTEPKMTDLGLLFIHCIDCGYQNFLI